MFNLVQEKYQEFKERVKGFKGTFEDSSGFNTRDHPSVIEVLFVSLSFNGF